MGSIDIMKSTGLVGLDGRAIILVQKWLVEGAQNVMLKTH